MSVEEQLAYEARVRLRQAAIAAVAGILLVAAAIIQVSGVHAKVDELTLDLITEHKRFPLDLVGAIVNSLGLIALGVTLNHLFAISRARNPEIQPWIRWLAVVGAVVSGIAAVIYAGVIAHKADQFVHHGMQTYQEANALTSGGAIVAIPLIAQLGSLLLTGGFIWISLNAMRVGLLTRWMGYLGIFAGVLVLFPIGSPVPIVQGFWLLAVAYLLTGRWPSGVPQAWSSGVAVPWPSNAQAREEREAQQRASRRAKGAASRQAKAEKMAKARSDFKAARRRGKVVESTATDVGAATGTEATGTGVAGSAAGGVGETAAAEVGETAAAGVATEDAPGAKSATAKQAKSAATAKQAKSAPVRPGAPSPSTSATKRKRKRRH